MPSSTRKPTRSDESESSDDCATDTEGSTDSEEEYSIEKDRCRRICERNGDLKEGVVTRLFQQQHGLCRISGVPFEENGLYEATVSARHVDKPITEKNAILVLKGLADMRSATQMKWRHFILFMGIVNKDAEL